MTKPCRNIVVQSPLQRIASTCNSTSSTSGLAILVLCWLCLSNCRLHAQDDQAGGKKPGDVKQSLPEETLDVIISRKDGTKITGKITRVTSSTIKMRQDKNTKNKIQTYLTEEYTIGFWNGVTNAAELRTKADKHFATAAKHLKQYRYGEITPAEVAKRVGEANKEGVNWLKHIWLFEGNSLENLPVIASLTEADNETLRTLSDDLEGHSDIAVRRSILQEDQLRKTIAGRQSRLNELIRLLDRGSFREAIVVIKIRDEETKQSQKSKGTPDPALKEFRQGLQQLAEICLHAQAPKNLSAQQPTLSTVRKYEKQLEGFEVAWSKATHLRVLGPEPVRLMTVVAKRHKDHGSLLREFKDTASGLLSVKDRYSVLERDPKTGRIRGAKELQKQPEKLHKLRQELDEVLKTLQESPNATGRLLVVEAVEFGHLLNVRIEPLLAKQKLAKIRGIKTREEAGSLAEDIGRSRDILAAAVASKISIPDVERREVSQLIKALSSREDQCREKAFHFDFTDAQSFLDQMSKERNVLIRSANDDRSSAVGEFTEMQKTLGQKTKEIESKLSRLNTESPDYNKLIRDMKAGGKDLDQAIKLFELHERIRLVPTAHRELASLELAKALLASAGTDAKKFPTETLFKELRPVSNTIDNLLRKKRSELKNSEIAIDADKAENIFADHFAEIDSLLNGGKTDDARLELFDTEEAIDKFAGRLVGSELDADSEFNKQLKSYRSKFEELNQHVEQARRDERTNAGWIPLPIPGDPLVPPGPESEWLAIDSLVSTNRFEESENALNRFAAEHTLGDWPERIAVKRAELSFRRGRDFEKHQDVQAATRAYQKTIDANVEHPVRTAAEAATSNIKVRLSEQEFGWKANLRDGGLACLGLLLAATVFYSVRRESTGNRVREASRMLQRAKDAARKGSKQHLQLYLRDAARMLAGLADHPEAESLREISEVTLMPRQTRRTQSVEAAAPVAEAAAPSTTAAVAEVIRSASADELTASTVVDWLLSADAQPRSSRDVANEAIKWLKKHLVPHASDLEDELRWKTRLAGKCLKFLPESAVWPRLYCMRGTYSLRDYANALIHARAMPSKSLHQQIVLEIIVTIGSSLIETENWTEAIAYLEEAGKRNRRLGADVIKPMLFTAVSARASHEQRRLNSKNLQKLLRAGTT